MQSKRWSSLEDLAKSGSKNLLYTRYKALIIFLYFILGYLLKPKIENLIVFTLFSLGGGGFWVLTWHWDPHKSRHFKKKLMFNSAFCRNFFQLKNKEMGAGWDLGSMPRKFGQFHWILSYKPWKPASSSPAHPSHEGEWRSVEEETGFRNFHPS